MKRFLVFFIMLFPFLLFGCSGGSYVISVGDLTSSSNTISGDYLSFSGYYFKEVELSKGDMIQFTYDVSTQKGSFSAKFLDSSGKVIKEISGNESVEISKDGTYKIQVQGKKHRGSFHLSWELVNSD